MKKGSKRDGGGGGGGGVEGRIQHILQLKLPTSGLQTDAPPTNVDTTTCTGGWLKAPGVKSHCWKKH